MAARRAETVSGRLRIIGGSLRGSRIDVADMPGLRPTPDRVRETLFNWLMPVIEGAHCLDLYAGTGALGIEALSRGAATVDFVEADAHLAERLRANLARLKQRAEVFNVDALRFVASGAGSYDVAFIDPPFTTGAWNTVAQALEDGSRLREAALIYIESPADETLELPSCWALHRHTRAGAVRGALYRRQQASAKL